MFNRNSIWIRLVLLGVAIVYHLSLQAQIVPMSTDRPDQTESPFLVPQAHLQLETGVGFEKSANSTEQDLPAVLIRIGLTEFAELRLGMEGLQKANTDIDYRYPWEPSFFAGLKMPIYKVNDGTTQISFIGHIQLAEHNDELFDLPKWGVSPDFRITVQHTLTDWYSLSYNAGCYWQVDARTPTYLYTVSNGFSISEHVGAFIEIFGEVTGGGYAPMHMLDGGLTYLLTDNMQFDISSGIGINAYAPAYFISAGYSIRLPD